VGWELVVIAASLLGFSVVSHRLAGTSITSAIVFVGVGLLAGIQALDLFDAPSTGESVKVLAEATLALVLFSDASRINLRALRREYTVPARLLGIGLPLTIVVGAIVASSIFQQLSLTEAVVIAVLLAPTDAALGQAVVTEPRLPSRIRQGLNVESGLNDGICVPLLFIALAVAEADAGSIGDAHAARIVGEHAPSLNEIFVAQGFIDHGFFDFGRGVQLVVGATATWHWQQANENDHPIALR
jgi:NhaP-type Na+/H+ or K+/H+ antiporter